MIQGWPISISSRSMLLRVTSNTHDQTLSETQRWTCCLQFVQISGSWQLPANAPGVCSDLAQTCDICLFVPSWQVMVSWARDTEWQPRHTSHFVTRHRSMIHFIAEITVPMFWYTTPVLSQLIVFSCSLLESSLDTFKRCKYCVWLMQDMPLDEIQFR